MRTIHPLLSSRRSPRAFDPGRNLSREDVETVLEAARWAPSCFNEQPWFYLVGERGEDIRAWEDILSSLVEGNRRWAERASVFVVVLARIRASDADHARRLACYDTGAASLNLCLQACSMGLAAHQIGGFDPFTLRRLFAISEGWQPMSVIALGHPGDPQLLDEKTRAREAAPRERRALKEFVAFGRGTIPS